MADISDVANALVDAITALAYPAGTSLPSAIGVPIQVSQGWPLAETLDAIAAKPGQAVVAQQISLVSVFPVPGTTGDGGTVMDFSPAVLAHAAAGLSVTVEDATISISGVAQGVENVVVMLNRGSNAYTFSAQLGDTAQVAAASLQAQIVADFPGSIVDLSGGADQASIDVEGVFQIIARVGTTGTLGRKVHRQRTQIRVGVWSSNQADRDTVAAAIDVMMKAQLRFPLPDTSAAIITYQGTNYSDDQERAGLYRRDLICIATYDTIEQLDAVEVVGVGIQTSLPSGVTLSSSS